jgi:hypothetical protein
MKPRVLLLCLSLGCSHVSANNSSVVGESQVESSRTDDENSKTLDCDDPKGYSVVEVRDSENYVNILRGDTVLCSIKLPNGVERNGFGFDWAKKTKEGFEIAIEYGSRIFYSKRFIFTCRHHRFYLSKIRVESFDRHNPEKWSRKVVRVQPNLPLEKFSITDFMPEGVSRK